MTVGELRNKLAGVNPNVPVILDGVPYERVYARWQLMIHPDLTRDVTIDEAVQGIGVMCLVLFTATRTAHPNDADDPTPPFRATEN